MRGFGRGAGYFDQPLDGAVGVEAGEDAVRRVAEPCAGQGNVAEEIGIRWRQQCPVSRSKPAGAGARARRWRIGAGRSAASCAPSWHDCRPRRWQARSVSRAGSLRPLAECQSRSAPKQTSTVSAARSPPASAMVSPASKLSGCTASSRGPSDGSTSTPGLRGRADRADQRRAAGAGDLASSDRAAPRRRRQAVMFVGALHDGGEQLRPELVEADLDRFGIVEQRQVGRALHVDVAQRQHALAEQLQRVGGIAVAVLVDGGHQEFQAQPDRRRLAAVERRVAHEGVVLEP